MTKKPYHHANLKQKLIETGIQLVKNKGIEQLSLRSIAAACNVSHTAPYRHFKNKTQLLAAIGTFIEEKFYFHLKDKTDQAKTIDQKILVLGKEYVLFFRNNPDYFHFFNQVNCHALLTTLDKSCENSLPFALFSQLAETFLETHRVPPEQHRVAMISMWALVQGLATFATSPNLAVETNDWDCFTQQILTYYLKKEQETMANHE